MTNPLPDDDLDRLARALRTQAPAADPAARDAALRLAMENFDRAQEAANPVRPSSEGRSGLWTGVHRMMTFLTSRGMLTATTSIVALGFCFVVLGPELQLPPNGTVSQGPVTVPEGGRAQTPKPVTATVPGQPEATVPAEAESRRLADMPATVPQMQPAPEPEGERRMELAESAPLLAPPPPPAPPATARAKMRADADAAAGAVVGGIVSESYIAAPSPQDAMPLQEENTEAFPEADINPIKVTAEEPVSTFSIDVDTASYAVVRSSLNAGALPPAEAVRVEEMVNYFPYDYAAPEAGEAPFQTSVTVMPAPWAEGKQLVRIGLQGRLPAVADRPPLNLVLLVDTSGSMQDANKLPLLKASLDMMLPELRPEDQVAIVAYAGSAGVVLDPTAAGERDTIMAALDRLDAGGSTAGAEGLELAYQTAAKMAGDGEVSRILLATDGDFNVGVSDPDGLESYVEKKRETGTYLSVLGFGRGNLDDATMQALAQAGNGTAAYIDTLNEARKVLVDQLSGALFPIADDVKIQVEWNPATVAEYRLLGYETRALAREDFNNDKVDAGEIGAGHQVTALYEITPEGSDARATDPLRYGQATAAQGAPSDELGFLRLRYKEPGEDASRLIETPIQPGAGAVDADAKFAAAMAGFGQLLTGSKYLGDWGWDQAIALANEGRGVDQFGYRAEAVGLMRLAQSLSR